MQRPSSGRTPSATCPLLRPSCPAFASGAQRSRPAGGPEERSTQLGLYPGCLGPGAGRRGPEGRRPASPAGSQLPRLARHGASSPPPPARQPARSPAHSGTPPGLDTKSALSGDPQKADQGSWLAAGTPAPPGPPRTQVPVLPPAGSQASDPADDLIATSKSGLVDKNPFYR